MAKDKVQAAEGEAKRKKIDQADFVVTFLNVVGLDGEKGTYQDVADKLGLAYGSVIQRATKYRKPLAEGGYGIDLPEPRRQGGGQKVDASALNKLIAERRAAAAAAAAGQTEETAS